MDEVNDESDPLRREAVDWVQRLASGRATAADAESLKRWCRRSPAHAAAYAEASRLWRDFGPAARNLRQRGELPPELVGPPRRAIGRRAVFAGALAAASAAAAYAVIEPPFGLWPSFAELTADYRTETGEQRQVALPGDVSVRMNTQTSIALQPSGEDGDRVELVAGEASFAAPLEPRRPLIVLAAGGRTIASAAGFDMWRTGPSVCVTCISGTVRVEQLARAATIGPGQQARYDETGLGPRISKPRTSAATSRPWHLRSRRRWRATPTR
jgi:transmembrane sensor